MNTWLLNSYLSILAWDWFIWRFDSPHPRVTQHSHTYLHDSERHADPQPYPETVHQVCRLHKQWHQDYVQLKVWYKNNDDNFGGVLNEYLALCVFSNSELFHWTKTCNKRFWWKWLVVRGDHYLKMQLVTWLLSFRWLPADTVTIFRCKHWSYRAKRNPLTEVPSEFAEMYQVAAC